MANAVNLICRSLITVSDDMTDKFRIFRRASGVWYIEDKKTRHQQSLCTRDGTEAKRLLLARNEAHRQPAINIQIARAYLSASDPKLITRTWQEVMDTLAAGKRGTNQDRWLRAINDRNFDIIRQLPLIETRADHFLKVMADKKVSSNVFLRRIHNYALAMDWLLKPVIPKASWPKFHFKSKRAITADEHRRIVEREKNPECRAFYQLCWHLGGSQMDMANLTAEDVGWNNQTICYQREKLKNQEGRHVKPPLIRFGEEVAGILRVLRSQIGAGGLDAQEALGHNSKAVHRAYAKNAEVRIDSLDEWEQKAREKIVAVQFDSTAPQRPGDPANVSVGNDGVDKEKTDLA